MCRKEGSLWGFNETSLIDRISYCMCNFKCWKAKVREEFKWERFPQNWRCSRVFNAQFLQGGLMVNKMSSCPNLEIEIGIAHYFMWMPKCVEREGAPWGFNKMSMICRIFSICAISKLEGKVREVCIWEFFSEMKMTSGVFLHNFGRWDLRPARRAAALICSQS